MEQLAKALREEMDRRQHSIRDAAALIGVASGTVVNWSKGWISKAPRVEHWQPVAVGGQGLSGGRYRTCPASPVATYRLGDR